jgi:choline dehydrogenase-like flavoprotein
MWARQTQRWSDFDFEGPARDGFAVDWPIRYADIAPWYSYVEKFAGITGNKDGVATLPDGEFLPPHEWNCVEKHFQQKIAARYNDRHVIMGRAAHLTQPKQIHYDQGRRSASTGLSASGAARLVVISAVIRRQSPGLLKQEK